MSPELLTIQNVTTEGESISKDIWHVDEHGSANLSGLDAAVGSGSKMTEDIIAEAAKALGKTPDQILEMLQKGGSVKY